MNYDLAMMALEGLTASRLHASAGADGVVIEADGDAFKELARLCLLLGSEGTKSGEEITLGAGAHIDGVKGLLLRKR
jgi:hypothetical protein